MSESTTVPPGIASDAFKVIVDVMFYKAIYLIKKIGAFFYMAVIMTLLSLLALVAMILFGLLIGSLFGKLIGVAASVLFFSLVLFSPLSSWMKTIKAATNKAFFGG